MLIKWLKRKKNSGFEGEAEQNVVEKCSVYYIRRDRIRPNPMRSRSDFDEDKLVDLSYSIKRYGVIEPLCVRKTDDDDSYEYALIAGERRFRAAKLAGLLNVPCIILDIEEPLAAEISLVENILHSNLNYFEVSASIKRLSELYEESFEDICARLSIPRSEALKKLLLLEFDFEERQMLLNSDICEDIALKIVKISDNSNRKELVQRICAAKDADIDVNKALLEISLEKDGNNSLDDTDDSITAVPRDICSVIRGIERRVRLLNRSRKRATFTVDRCESKIVITLNIKA